MSLTQTEKPQPILTSESNFRFGCHDNIPCFTQCCRDVNIYLTPYDVLRLRRALKIGSAEFLSKYTLSFLGGLTNIPVVQFKMDPTTLYCQFVKDSGCTVYEDRPWACRMFPLDITPMKGEYRLFAGKERCLGVLENTSWKVKDWLTTQGVEPYTEMELAYQRIIPPGFKPVQRMEAGSGNPLYLAYDLDRFAQLLEDQRFRTSYALDDDRIAFLRENDEEMLKLAFRHIRSQMDELC